MKMKTLKTILIGLIGFSVVYLMGAFIDGYNDNINLFSGITIGLFIALYYYFYDKSN